MIEKNKNWMVISISGLVLSFLSLMLPVINYTPESGNTTVAFNIVKLLDGETFVKEVLWWYRGDFLFGMEAKTANLVLLLLCAIAIAAIVLSYVGLKSMSKQYESIWPFVLTLAGIICTAIPAVVILVAVLMSGDEFAGTLSVGAYSYVTPIAMVISCVTVTKRHKLTQEEIRIQKAASAYIKPAGDLPLQ